MKVAPLFSLLGLPCVLLLAAGPLVAASEPLDDVEKAAGDWIKLRVETVRLDTAWRSERPILESTVAALRERAAALEERRDVVEAKTAKDRDEIETLSAKNHAASAALQTAEARLKQLGAKLLAARPSLPPRLSDALELSFRSLANPELSVGERMRLTTTVLGRCAQFNRQITTGEDLIAVAPGAAPQSVQTIYWGLSHAYALDRAAGQAWLGSPGPDGWRWEAQPDAARAVAALLAIQSDQADPDFVIAPARLGRAAEPTAAK